MTSFSQRLFLKECLWPYRGWILGQVIVVLIWALDVSLRPYLLKRLIDIIPFIETYHAFAFLGPWIVLYFLTSVVIMGVDRLYDFMTLRFIPPLKATLSQKLMSFLITPSPQEGQKTPSGALANKISLVTLAVPDLLNLFLYNFLSHAIAVLVAMGTFMTISWVFSGLLGLWALLFLGISLVLSQKSRDLSEQVAHTQSQIMARCVDVLSHLLTVRLFGQTSHEQKHLGKEFQKGRQKEQVRDLYFLKLFSCQSISVLLYQGLCLFFLLTGFSEGKVTPGDFVLILTLNLTLMDRLWTLSHDINRWFSLRGLLDEALKDILPDQTRHHSREKELSAQLFLQEAPSINFDRITFSYQGKKPLFKDFEMRIYPQEKVGIIGPSGIGKSTLLQLLLGVYPVTKGKILINGQDIATVTPESLRSAIGIVSQEPFLFQRSLLDNVCYGCPQASFEDVEAACAAVQADDFIKELPQGYDTIVGEKGMTLSGGQRQRLSFARVLLKKAPILVLDEATSQMDMLLEEQIQAVLKEFMKDKTVLLISHRQSLMKSMDRVIDLLKIRSFKLAQ